MVVLVLILVLVAIPLYLWRRPRAVADDVQSAAGVDASVNTVEIGSASMGAGSSPSVDGGVSLPAGLSLSEVRVLECHDPGAKRTLAKDCDHLPSFERVFAQAIADNASCVPTSAGGGVVVYDVDVSFARKKQPVMLSVPHEGRTLKSAKAANACGAAVKKSLGTVMLEDATHQHSRYRLEIAATYSLAGSPAK